MILPFSTKFKDGKPTCFIEKIWIGLLKEVEITGINDYEERFIMIFGETWDGAQDYTIEPKLHTIREDVHNRWYAGRMIHPVINNRSKNQFQFAPVFPCVSTQKIEIINRETYQKVTVDGSVIFEKECCSFYLDQRFKELVKNDGFPSVKAFWAWFDHDFTGKIIHWTDLKY